MKKQELLKALEAVKPGLASREMIEQTTSFAFLNDRVVTFNDEISISYPIDIRITGAVRAEEFYSLLSKIKTKKDDEIELIQEENEIRVLGKRITAGVKLQSDINLPLDEVDEISDKWFLMPEKLLPALKLCAFSASKNMSRPILTCLYCSKKEEAVYASDSYRISKAEVPKIKQDITIPATIAQELVKYDFSYYQVKPNWAHFKSENGLIFSFRIVDGEFPIENCEQHLKVKGQEIRFPSEMKEMLIRSEIFAKRESAIDQEININIKGKLMFLSGQNEYGWIKEKVCIENSVEQEINFTINPTFLRQILSEVTQCIVGEQLILFSTETFKHAIALCDE